MSEYENANDDIPRFEPWLGVMVSAVIPALLALYVPSGFLVPLIAVTVALFAAGLVMLRRQQVAERGKRS